jgi:hypothetical protein
MPIAKLSDVAVILDWFLCRPDGPVEGAKAGFHYAGNISNTPCSKEFANDYAYYLKPPYVYRGLGTNLGVMRTEAERLIDNVRVINTIR